VSTSRPSAMPEPLASQNMPTRLRQPATGREATKSQIGQHDHGARIPSLPAKAPFRREFRAAVKAAGIEGRWSPRELRHTFVSLMSDSGVPVEEIARLAGHTSSRTTEIVYRHQLRPVMEKAPKPSTSSSDAPPDRTRATLARA
jgi:integrase